MADGNIEQRNLPGQPVNGPENAAASGSGAAPVKSGERYPYSEPEDRVPEAVGAGEAVEEPESLEEGFASPAPEDYERPDANILDDINETLTEHPDIDPRTIDITVEDGVVTLSGAVDSRRDRILAEDLITVIRGVQEVRNELRVTGGEPEPFERLAGGG